MYVAYLGIIACTVLSGVPLVNIFALVGVLVYLVMYYRGIYYASKNVKACKVAFYMGLSSVVMNVVTTVHKIVPFLPDIVDTICDLGKDIIMFLVGCIVLVSVSKVLRESGAKGMARLGKVTFIVDIKKGVDCCGNEVIGIYD